MREIVDGTVRIFPAGPGKSRVFYINLPNKVRSESPFSEVIVAYSNITYTGAIEFYYLVHKIETQTKLVDVLATVKVDLGYKKVRAPSAWYDICETARRISSEEYSALARDKENTLLFFNPSTEKLVDVSGWSYKKLAESVLVNSSPRIID